MSLELRHTDKIASILLVVFAAAVFVASQGWPTGPTSTPGAAFFPRIIAASIAFLAVVQFALSAIRDEDTRITITRKDVVRVGIPFLLVVAYIAFMPIFGFLVGTVMFLVVLMWYSGAKELRVTIPVSFGVAVVLFYVFASFLHVPLPESAILPVSRLLPDLGVF